MLAVLTRLPLLTGGNLALDGDECVVGLMATHLAEGRELPLFFWGQRYGFTLVEAGVGAALFLAGGPSVLLLKLAELILFALGCVFLVGSARRLAGDRAAVLAALLILFAPAWGAWSLKARGGYVTAFAAAHAVVWLCVAARSVRGPARAASAGVGLLVPVVYWAQPLWVLPTLPFLGAFLVRGRPRSDRALAAVCTVAVFTALALAARSEPSYWVPPGLRVPDVPAAVTGLSHHLRVFLGGAFFFGQDLGGGAPVRVASLAWLVALAAGLALRFLPRFRAPGLPGVRTAWWAVVVATFAPFLLGADVFFHRYLLPLPGFLALLLAAELAKLSRAGRGRILVPLAAAVLIGTGAGALVRLGDLSFFSFPAQRVIPEAGRTQRLVDALLERGIHHVYCTDPLFQWNVTFTSGERVVARWTDPRDRRPEYPAAVDDALRSGRRAAIVGDVREAAALNDRLDRAGLTGIRAEPVAELFYVLESPPEALVRAMGFAPAP